MAGSHLLPITGGTAAGAQKHRAWTQKWVLLGVQDYDTFPWTLWRRRRHTCSPCQMSHCFYCLLNTPQRPMHMYHQRKTSRHTPLALGAQHRIHLAGGGGGRTALSLSKQLKGRFKEGSREVASFPLVDRLHFSAWCSLTTGTRVLPCFHSRVGWLSAKPPMSILSFSGKDQK